jgi:hypothetical protein
LPTQGPQIIKHEKLTIVVMTKPAVASKVKTRLIGHYSPRQAAEIHQAMLDCVTARLETHFDARLVLAVDLPDPADWPASPPWQVIGQGRGDLGSRIAHVWEEIGSGPAAFFGVDSPDIPAGHLASILRALADHDAAVGPVDDGGYWTLAGAKPTPDLLRDIDWGSTNVYQQTLQRAGDHGLRLQSLDQWFDIDEPDDLAALRQRIASSTQPPLVQLGRRLNNIVQS